MFGLLLNNIDMSAKFKSDLDGCGLTLFAEQILCDDSTGFGEVDKYFATEVDTIKGILYEQVVYRLKTYGGNMLVS